MPRVVTKLVRNYRSHAALLELPSRISYDSELVECADRQVTGSMGHWDELVSDGFPLLFYGCASAHSLYRIDPGSAHPSSSYRNVTECEKVIELLTRCSSQWRGWRGWRDGEMARMARMAARVAANGAAAEPAGNGAGVAGGRTRRAWRAWLE